MMDVAGLIKNLSHEDPQVRKSAVLSLGDLGTAAEQAVPYLIQALNDNSNEVCKEAVRALGKIGPAAEEAIPELVLCLERDAMQEVVVKFLLGTHPETLVPRLINMMDDRCPELRSAALNAVWWIGNPSLKDIAPRLIQALNDKQQGMRGAAVDALASIGTAAKDAVPHLIPMLKEGNLAVYVAEALVNMGPSAKAAIPAVTDAIKAADRHSKESLQKALKILQSMESS